MPSLILLLLQVWLGFLTVVSVNDLKLLGDGKILQGKMFNS